MSFGPAFFDLICRQGKALHASVVGRDKAHLRPDVFSRAAARRLRSGLRALEAWVRRVLFLMAIEIEPGLTSNLRPYVKYRRAAVPPHPGARFRAFKRPTDLPGTLSDGDGDRGRRCAQGAEPAAPLLNRLALLQALIEAPQGRARRLAFYLARNRPGRLLPPDFQARLSLRRFGVEISALYQGFGPAILEASSNRPPPLGPRPRAGPRIRRL